MLDNIVKFPIVILSSPRSGSTALLEILNKRYSYLPNWRAFDEPLYPSRQYDDFIKFIELEKNNYAVKIQMLEYEKSPDTIKDLVDYNHCTLVALYRKDVVSQYLSQYIADARGGKFKYFNNNKNDMKVFNDEVIKVDMNHMACCISDIDLHINKLKKSYFRKDFTIYFENIPFSEQSLLFKTPKPKNFDELRDVMDKLNEKKNTLWFKELVKNRQNRLDKKRVGYDD